jgi:TRAP-type C4-dicarboxylate transport system substrate-binding protein
MNGSLRSSLRLAVLALSFAALLVAPAARAQTKWDMPTPYPASNFHTENIAQFVKDVEAATAGKLAITVHPNGSLFKANEIKRAVQGGQVQIGEVIISGYANEDAFFAMDTVPFLATSYADARRLLEATRGKIEQKFDKQGMKILFSVVWPPQGLYTKKTVNSLADLKGVKIRSYSPTVARMIELMGAQPVTIQAAELAQALATGVVDANFTSSATGYDTKSWEQLSHYYDVHAWLPKNVVFVNKKTFAALDAATQEAVMKAAKAAEERGWKSSEEKNRWYLEQLKANKMQVVQPPPALAKELAAIGEKMTVEWAEKAGPDAKAALEAYRAGAKKM